MPITKSAIKKIRQDKDRRLTNLRVIKAVKEAIHNARKTPTAKALQKAYSALDKASKKKVIHKNTASRLKSRLAKKVAPKTKKA